MTEKHEPTKEASSTGLYIVRLYDGFDHVWMDVSNALPWEEALAAWKEKTEDGTKNIKYSEIDYYNIFPSGTKMLYSSENSDR